MNHLHLKHKFNSDEISNIKDRIIESEETNIKTIYFKKKFQRLFDDDNTFRFFLHEMHKLLPQDLRDILKIMICNKIDNKIRKFLSWNIG